MTAFWEGLYRDHGPALLAYLRRCSPDRAAAEDLLQDTFLQAARRPARLAEAVSPRAWLFAIARNLARAAWRQWRPTERLATDVPAQGDGDADDRVELLRSAIARLPEEQREVLELRLRHELSYEEIANVLAVPVGTVRSRLHHAVRRLRERLHAET